MVLFAAFDANSWIMIIGAVAFAVERIINAWNQRKRDSRIETIHGLVNSALGDVKKNLAVTARAKAEITNSPADIAAAEAAEQDSARHDKTQTEQNLGARNG